MNSGGTQKSLVLIVTITDGNIKPFDLFLQQDLLDTKDICKPSLNSIDIKHGLWRLKRFSWVRMNRWFFSTWVWLLILNLLIFVCESYETPKAHTDNCHYTLGVSTNRRKKNNFVKKLTSSDEIRNMYHYDSMHGNKKMNRTKYLILALNFIYISTIQITSNLVKHCTLEHIYLWTKHCTYTQRSFCLYDLENTAVLWTLNIFPIGRFSKKKGKINTLNCIRLNFECRIGNRLKFIQWI